MDKDATPLMTLSTDLDLSERVSIFQDVRLVTVTSPYFPFNGRGRTLVNSLRGVIAKEICRVYQTSS